MAFKRKIDKTAFDALSDAHKALYTENSGNYELDVERDEDNQALKNAKDREKQRADDAEANLTAIRTELNQLKDSIADDQRKGAGKKGNVEEVEKAWQTKFDNKVKELTDQLTARDSSLENILVSGKAEALAAELFGEHSEIGLLHIKQRLKADLSGSTPVTKVLDKDGNLSALTIDELKKEYLDNPKYASIVVGSRGSGGGANGNGANGGGASKKPSEMTTAERTHLYNTNPTEFARLFPQAVA